MSASAAPAPFSTPTQTFSSPEDFLTFWVGRLNEGRVEQVLALYDTGAVLIPTFADRLLTTPDGIRGYFEGLAAREGLHVELEAPTVTTQDLGGGRHVISGLYGWRFAVAGQPVDFAARFSYVLDLGRPRPVLHHHSSRVPPAL